MSGPAFRIGEEAVSEEAFYAAACDPQRSVVVEACAGAGKTWMLVSRILRALLAGAQPQQILAITFTRKAAGEMRERLHDWLREFSDLGCDAQQRVRALRQRGLSAAEAQALAPALGGLHEQILRGGRGVEVQTFHGWFAQLLSHAPLALLERLALPPVYELIEDPSLLRDELFRRFHGVVQADPALRADYIAMVAKHRRGTLLQWLSAAWQGGPELARADAAGSAEDGVPAAEAMWPECRGLDDPAELLHRAPLVHDIDTLARQLGASGKARAMTAASGLRDALQAGAADTAFETAWAALFTEKDKPRLQLGDSPLRETMVDALERVREMRQQQQAHQDHARMLRLARVLLREYAALKRRRGLVDMADLEQAAEALLGDSELAGWVQERLDQRLRHLLIDEFQDTSPLQWQVLHAWLSSYAGAGGGASGQRPPALFIVGDPKQSIYRFRGAEPRVFAAARDFVRDGLEGEWLQCDHSRRSAPALVAALNAVFEDASRLEDFFGPYRPHTTASDAVGTVRRLPGVARPARAARWVAGSVWRDSLTQPRQEPELRLKAAEAAQVATAVAALLTQHGLQPGEIMVLARRRSTLALVADALAAEGVPHVLAEPLALRTSPEALDLTAVLDVLASPGHDLSLARALKSPIFGADDTDLLWLAPAGRGAWRGALLGAGDPPSPSLQRAQALLSRWLEVADVLPPHDLLERIVHEGDVRARLAAAVRPARLAGALHAVQALLGAALSHQGGRFASLYGFVRELRGGRVSAKAAAPAAAVQLLTVHGAKGLEARAVIVADADPEPRPPGRATLLVDWRVEEAAPRRVAFLRSESRVPFSLRGLFDDEAAAREREELNGLYVAMTRAREWLVFSRTASRGRGGRSWWARVERQADRWTPVAQAAALTSADPPAAARVPVLPALIRPAVLAPGISSAPGDAAAARLGQAVHRVLEWCGRPGAADVDLQAASQAAAAEAGLGAAAAPSVHKLAAQILGSTACAPFFSGPALRWAGNEVPVAAQGQTLRIDRLVALREGDGGQATTWWVLDYKLHSTPTDRPADRAQLERYVAAIQALQPGDAVRGAFITGRGELIVL